MLPMASTPPPAATSPSTSTLTTARGHHRHSGSNGGGGNNSTTTSTSESPSTLQKNAMRRSASVSRSLGAPDKARHVALLSRLSGDGFDPYSIFLTPHYTDEQLRRHRGWMRLLPENWKVPVYVLVWYWPPLALELAVSASLAAYETWGPPAHDGWRSLARSELAVPFQLTSFCLSILLVFRTTASFERWNEARKIWGSVGVETRSIARQAKAWVERAGRQRQNDSSSRGGVCDEEEARHNTRRTLAELLSWCAAAPIALKAAVATDVEGTALLKGVGRCHVDGGGFEGVLTHKQQRRLWRATKGRPLLAPPCVLDRISQNLAKLPLSDMLLATLDARVAAIAALASSADRLKRQPIPPAYTRNTARFLAVWLFFLPLALWHPLQLWSIPACVIIAFLLVAVENVGSQLESPHPVLPVDELVGMAVAGVQDAGGRWWLEPEEREMAEEEGEEGEEEETDESDDDESDEGGGGEEVGELAALAAGAAVTATVPPLPATRQETV